MSLVLDSSAILAWFYAEELLLPFEEWSRCWWRTAPGYLPSGHLRWPIFRKAGCVADAMTSIFARPIWALCACYRSAPMRRPLSRHGTPLWTWHTVIGSPYTTQPI